MKLNLFKSLVLASVFGLAGRPVFAASFDILSPNTETSAKTLAAGETGSIAFGASLVVGSGNQAISITGSGAVTTIINSGTISHTGSGRAIRSNDGSNIPTIQITNTATGVIKASGSDVIKLAVDGTIVTIDNYGLIDALSANQALDFDDIATAGKATINNYGSGIIRANGEDAIRSGANAIIINEGRIEAIPALDQDDNGFDVADGNDGIDVRDKSGVQITNSGTISGRHGITGGEGVDIVVTVTNLKEGVLTGVNGAGINIDESGSFVTVDNRGVIEGYFDSTKYEVGDGDGVDVDGLVMLTNSGIIRGVGAGGVNDSDNRPNNAEGVSIGGGTVINLAGGKIIGENPTGTSAAGNGILVDDSSGGNAFAATTIINSGLIQGKSGYAIKIIGTFADTVTNHAGGVIQGAGAGPAVETGGGNDVLTNRGAIISETGVAIDLGAGDDSLLILGGQASIIGDVYGGPGVNSLVINPGPGGAFTFNGTFFDFGAAVFQSGRTVLSGTSTFPDGASVTGGSLIVNGTLVTPVVTVGSGGLLGGGGFITGNVTNAGVVSPGNSIGTLRIGGNYHQSSGGALLIEVSGPSRSDVLVVGGTAHLDGTLRIARLGRSPRFGDQFKFLRAGRITGDFDRILMPDPGVLRGRFLKSGGTGILLVAPASYTLVAQNANQARAARALDRWIGIEDGDAGEVTLALDLLSAEQYSAAFEAIMPGYYEAALSTAIELSQNHGQLLHQQLSARRLGQRALAQAPSASPEPVGGKSAKSVQKAAAPVQPLADDHRWTAWMQGSGLFSGGGLSLNPGEDFESGTFLVGADYALSEHFALGFFASYQEGWSDYDSEGEMDLESVRFGLYAAVDHGGFYANTAIGGGTTDFDITRPVKWATLDRTAHSSPDAAEFFTLAGAGYDFAIGNITVGPQFSAQYTRQKLDGLRESGAGVLDLELDDTTAESLRTYLGGRIACTFQASESVVIIPEIRAFWQHEFLQDGETLKTSLDGGSGPGFDYVTRTPDRDALFVGAGVGVQVGSQMYFNVYYNADLGRGDDANQTVSVSASFKF